MKFIFVSILVLFFSSQARAVSFVHGPRIASVFRDSVFMTAETDQNCLLEVIFGEQGGPMSETAFCSVSDTFHTAVLRNFGSSRNWRYSVRAYFASETIQTPVRTFRMPAAPGESFTFAVLGDAHCRAGSSGISTHFRSLIELICQYDPDFVLFLGDGIHGSYYPGEMRQQWDNFKEATDTITFNRPVFMVIGNHDANTYYQNFNGGDIFADEFEFPKNAPVPQFYEELVYHFEWGDACFYILDSDYYLTPEIIDIYQRNWLNQNLQSCPRRFKITAHHEHAWSYEGDLYGFLGEHPAERDAYWKVLRDNGVILDMAGHIHLYNRNFFGRTLPDTVMCVKQLISGGGGGSIVGGYGGDFYHFCLIEIGGNSLSVTAIDETGTVRDAFSLTAVEEKDDIEPDFSFPEVTYMQDGFGFRGGKSGELTLFDISGRILFEKKINPGVCEFFSPQCSGIFFASFDDGLYVNSIKLSFLR
ncbi:metallophosphoesterase [candidate division WOR-3 bacterium]|nr:metallophosphoesterase [candidate division WOR-3 bacterium]